MSMRLVKQRRALCYWCDAKRLRKNLRRITLAGPARRRVYECRWECRPTIQWSLVYGGQVPCPLSGTHRCTTVGHHRHALGVYGQLTVCTKKGLP